MNLNQLLETLDPNEELEFSPQHIELTSGKEMFALTATVGEHYIIKDPLYLYYVDVDQTLLKKYNPYTADSIFALNPSAVTITAPLSDEYKKYYQKALDGIYYNVDSTESSGDATLH